MMRAGLRQLGVHSGEACMIGDNLQTDVIAGVQSGMETILVLSGFSRARPTSTSSPIGPTTS